MNHPMLWLLRTKKVVDSPKVSSSATPPEPPATSTEMSPDLVSDSIYATEAQENHASIRNSVSSDYIDAHAEEMNFMIYTDVVRATEELTGAFENMAKAARNFVYTYETLADNRKTEDPLPDSELNFVKLIEFATMFAEVNREMAESFRSKFTAPLKKEYNACCTMTQCTIEGNGKKMTQLVKEMRGLETKTHKLIKTKSRDPDKFENNVQQLRRMGAEVEQLRLEKETKADDLARASRPFILNNCQGAVSSIGEHYVPFANAVVNLSADFHINR